ncbi:hypothetical protein SAMN05444358_101133 [Ruegeria halocynthiae]|uniref:Reverse transcriptase (RNA-dependent DNA polymerase) n=1 Tax=Ruegeria halocynthiae TaxID=985054 RepID=A0A1H2RGF5_9RHOB|nr:hypothetical protein [Ruegeria halocynthiae]SDW17739.1 hypothetical protein SAMN05444358_101133 [Ruegeria halocynthiae]
MSDPCEVPNAQRMAIMNLGSKFHMDRKWSREIGWAYEVYHQRAEAIHSATMSGKRPQPVTRDFLRSPHAKLVSAYKALGGSADPDQVRALSRQVDAWATDYPPIRWYPKTKPDRSSRPICVLPPALKAAQYLIREVINQQTAPNGSLFGIPGASRDDLARQLKQLQNSGYVYLAKTDVVDCYQSINPDALYSLPLPQEVTRRALDTRSLHFSVTHHPNNASQAKQDFGSSGSIYGTDHNVSGPKGLMQGSPASGVVLAHLLVGLSDSANARVMICFDNIVIAARTPAGTRAMADTLAVYLERCPAGPLAMCEPEFSDDTPMDFLGYRFDPSRDDIGIAEDALSRLEERLGIAEQVDMERLHALLETYEQSAADPTQITPANPLLDAPPVSAWRVLRDWRAGFPAARSDGPELSHYLRTSADATIDHPRISHLHENLFADPGTWENDAIRAILKRHCDERG